VDLWFGDETGIEATPRPYVVGALKGSKPTIPYVGDPGRQSVIGAVRPSDGYFFSRIVPIGNPDLFQGFLDERNRRVRPDQRNILILDNVSFHNAKRLHWGRLQPLYLPPDSPNWNPIEERWLSGKKTFFKHWIPQRESELENRTAAALNYFADNPSSSNPSAQ